MVSFAARLAGQGAGACGLVSPRCFSYSDSWTPADDPKLLALSDGRAVTLTAHVIREGYAHAAGPRSRQSLDVETEEIQGDGNAWPVRAGIRLSLYERVEISGQQNSGGQNEDGGRLDNAGEAASPPPALAFPYGTRLRIRAKLHAARNFRNPGAFDYEGYLRDNGVSMLGSAQIADVETLAGFSGSRIARWRARVHASIIRKIHELWPARQATLMDAMVLGEESFLRNATRTEFQRSGTYHLLVVSGMNLSILAFAILWTLRKVRLDPAIAAVTTVVVSFAYAFVVGVGPPVWRAALMLAIYLGARLLYRERNMLNAIGAAAIGVLVADPDAVFGASFQLTFLAVVIIGGIGEPLLQRSTLPYARALRLLKSTSYDLHVAPGAAELRLDLRLIARRLSRLIGERAALLVPALLIRLAIGVGELIFISALMQAGLALLMAYHFHRATTMGVPANFAVTPLTQVLMPAAAAAVGIGYVSTTVAKPAVWISGLALDAITGTVHWFGGAKRGKGVCRSARGNALDGNDPGGARSAGVGDDCRPESAHRRRCLACIAGCGRVLDCVCSFTPAHSTRRDGNDDDRCRTGRLHPAGDAARPCLAG